MAKALAQLFGSSPPEDAVGRAISGSSGATSAYLSIGAQGEWDIEQAVKSGLEKVIWVFRAVDAIASTQANTPMVIRKGSNESTDFIEDSELLELMNRYPNGYETAWQFRYRLSTMCLLSRRGAFVEVVRSNGGAVQSLHLVPPNRIAPIPDDRTFVSGYRVWDTTGGEVELPPERIVWVRPKPHPLDPYLCLTPMVASGVAADVDYYSRLFNRNFIANDGRPGMLVAVQGRLNPRDQEELKRRFSGGPSAAGQTSVIEADGLSVQDMSSSPRDVQWMEGIRGSKEDIFLAFGTPESVMGNASGRTFDNADAEREMFYVDTMLPHNRTIATALDILTSDRGRTDDMFLGFDYSGVDVLGRQATARRQRGVEEFRQGLTTINDFLALAGQDELDLAGARVRYHPSGIIIGDEEDVKKVQAAGKGPETPPDQERAARQGAEEGAREAGNRNQAYFRDIMQRFDQGAKRAHAQDGKSGRSDNPEEVGTRSFEGMSDVHRDTEMKADAALVVLMDRMADVVPERLNHVKARKGTRHWSVGPDTPRGAENAAMPPSWDGKGHTGSTATLAKPANKALDADYALDVERWAEEARASFAKILAPMAKRAARRAARDAIAKGAEERFRSRDPLERILGKMGAQALMMRVTSDAMNIVENSIRYRINNAARRIAKMDREGADLVEIANDVRARFGRDSKWRKNLALNIATGVAEGSRYRVHSSVAGPSATKTWYSMADTKVRDSHRHLDGTTVPIGAPFRGLTGATLMFPGDPTAPAAEVANCRCYLAFSLGG